MCLTESHLDLPFIWSSAQASADRVDPGEYVGDGFLAMHAAEQDFDPSRAAFRTWAQRRIRWTILERRRSEFRRAARHTDLRASGGSVEADVTSIDSSDFVAWCARQFTGRCREVVLGLARGMKRSDLARWLGVSEATVYMDLRETIRPKLKALLA